MSVALAEALRVVIRASGRSASELSAYSTVDKGVITRFLRGERSMTLETAGRVLEALGCAVTISAPDPNAPLTRVRRKTPPRRRGG
jgi:hypothetical protein